jgi:hypothetical protein
VLALPLGHDLEELLLGVEGHCCFVIGLVSRRLVTAMNGLVLVIQSGCVS